MIRGLFAVACFLQVLIAPVSRLAGAQPAPEVIKLGQLVAIKDVCAWPKLIVTPGGELVAALYNQSVHGVRPGDVDVYASTDDGLTWTKRGTATRHAKDSARFNHALGVTSAGELLLISGGWEYDPQPNEKAPWHKKKLLRPTTSRSTDGGRTWSISTQFPDGKDGMTLVPFGNVVCGVDGTLRVAAYSFNPQANPREDICYTAMSQDNGSTWTLGSVIGRPAANETDIVRLRDGRWLAAARNLGRPDGRKASTDIYVSDDDARTWRLLGTPTHDGQHPADLLQLVDGRVVLTVGDRNNQFGVSVLLSADRGATWSAPKQIARTLSGDSGYPSTAQLKDGTLVTVFYAAKTAEYGSYQMGAVRWRLP